MNINEAINTAVNEVLRLRKTTQLLRAEVQRLRIMVAPMPEDRLFKVGTMDWWRWEDNRWFQASPPLEWMETNSKAGMDIPDLPTTIPSLPKDFNSAGFNNAYSEAYELYSDICKNGAVGIKLKEPTNMDTNNECVMVQKKHRDEAVKAISIALASIAGRWAIGDKDRSFMEQALKNISEK